jgi:hypothetical protein
MTKSFFAEVALVWASGDHGRAAITAAQERLKGTHVESTLGFRGVMTLCAMLFEERLDMRRPKRVAAGSGKRRERQDGCERPRDATRQGVGFFAESSHRRCLISD